MTAIYLSVALALLNHTSFKGSKMLISLYALEHGAHEVAIGVLYGLYSLAPIVLAVYAGRLSDRFGMRMPMLFGSTGLLLGLLVPWVVPGLPALFVSAALIGSCYIFFLVAMQSLVGAIGPESDRSRNFATYSLGVAASNLFGPLVVGFSIDGFGHADTYRNLALVPLIVIAWLAVDARFLPRGAPKAAKPVQRPAFSMLTESPTLRRVLLTGGAIETGLELYSFYMPLYGHAVGLSASEIGVVMSVYAAALMVIRVLMPRLARMAGEAAVLRASLVAAALLYAVFPFFTGATALAALSFGLGLALGCCSPLSMVLTYNCAPAGRAGEAMGVRQTFNKLTETSAPVVFGAAGAAFGMLPVFWVSALLLVGGSLLARMPDRRPD